MRNLICSFTTMHHSHHRKSEKNRKTAGTTGAFTSTSLIGKFGYNFSAFLSPVLFTLAGACWFFVSALGESAENKKPAQNQSALAELENTEERKSFAGQLWVATRSFGKVSLRHEVHKPPSLL